MKEPFDEWAELRVGRLYEAALRLLGALGTDPAFPPDVEGVERLIGRVAEGEPGEVMEFAAESPDELPRFSGEYRFWVSPTGDGSVRIRAEDFGLDATAAVLSPEGRLHDFSTQEGFGVPEAALTEQAISDRDRIERQIRDQEAEAPEHEQQLQDQQRRFRTEHLLAVRAAPWQEPGGLVVTWVALYDTGLILRHLAPPPPDGEIDPDDWHADALFAAAQPPIQVSDDLGNEYEEVDTGRVDVNGPLLRASREFGPPVPEDARYLVIRSESGLVEIELGPR